MKLASDAPSRAPGDAVGPTRPLGNRWLTAGVVVTVAVGIALRFATRSDLWLDEALTVNIAKLPLGDLEEALRHDGAPPLYYVLLHLWMEVFGTGDLAVRAISGVCAVAALPVAWCVGRRVGGPLVAGAFVLVLASSPYAIRFATENRPYSLQILLVLVGWLLLLRALEQPSLARLAPLAAVVGLLLYTQYWSMYLLAVVGICLLWWAVKAPTAPQRHAARSAVVAMVAGGVTFLPWMPTFLYQAENTGTPWGEPILPPAGFAYTAIDFGGGITHSEAYVLLVLLLLLGLLAVFGRPIDSRRIELDIRARPGVRVIAVVLVAALFLGVAASYAAGTTFVGRYASVVFPLFALVAAFGFTAFADSRVRIVGLALVVALGFVGGARNLVENRTQGEQSARIIRDEARPGDVVVYCPDQVGPDVSRLVGDEPGLEQVTFPDGSSPELIDWVDYQDRIDRADPAQFAAEVLALAGSENTLWYVAAPGYRNFEGECEAVGAALSAGRPPAPTRVAPDDQFFEFQGLVEYPPP
ncbi:MAG: glycosyltransferase family 39 protein [Acidimicrobiia bacterium]